MGAEHDDVPVVVIESRESDAGVLMEDIDITFEAGAATLARAVVARSVSLSMTVTGPSTSATAPPRQMAV
jgi:hypothetical protein